MIILSPGQCRAARGLLDMRQSELADAAGVGLSSVRDLETGRRECTPETLAAIRAALESAGVEIIASGGRSGVRLAPGAREPDPRRRRDMHGNTAKLAPKSGRRRRGR